MIDHGLLIFTQLILHLVKMDFVVLCEGEMSNYLYVIKQAMDILIGKGKAKNMRTHNRWLKGDGEARDFILGVDLGFFSELGLSPGDGLIGNRGQAKNRIN